MSRLDTVIRKLEQLSGPLLEEIIEKAADQQRELMERLQIEQLDDGQRADGTTIGPPYAPLTVQLKRQKGQQTSKVTLLDQGNFRNSLKAEKHGKAYHMEFKDRKTEALLDKYGPTIEGLQEDNIDKVSRAMLPDIEKQLRKFLSL
jgi:hypothetical protein